MTRLVAIGCIVVFWLTMMTLLVKREVLPAWVEGRRPTYRAAADHEDLPRRTQMGIYLGNRRVGTSRSRTRRDTDGALVIESTTAIEGEVPLLRFRSRFDIASWLRVGPKGQLERFRIHAKAPGFERTIHGEVAGRELVMTSRTGRRSETWTVPFERRDVLSHDLSVMEGLGDLRVGQRWCLQNLNPLTGRYSIVRVDVRRRETLTWRGRKVETFLVVSNINGLELRAWVKPDGEVLRQELPGLMLEREPYDEPGPGAQRDTDQRRPDS